MTETAVALGGEPATGKSSLMLRVIESIGEGARPWAWRTLRGHAFDRSGVLILGLYEGKPFPGTDRLSMQAPADLRRWLDAGAPGSLRALTFEGDRLFGLSALGALRAAVPGTMLVVLEAGPEELTRRHAARRDGQTEAWLRGRRTKVQRIAREMGAERWESGSLEQARANAARLTEALRSSPGRPGHLTRSAMR